MILKSSRTLRRPTAFAAKLEPMTGFEPVTYCLRNSCSTN